MKRSLTSKTHPRLEGVAPPQLIREDYTALDAKSILRCSFEVEQLLLMQSVEGHAHAGHGLFYGKTYPNTTQDDVARALKLDPETVKQDRQTLIEEIHELVERIAAGEEVRTACNANGEPLLRCGTLRNLEIDPLGLMKGLYLGGLRDEAETRAMAGEKYGTEIGYGKCYFVDQTVLKKLGMNGYDLARRPHEHEIEKFREAGLFSPNGDGNVAYMYVRYKAGPGASDDAAIVIAGKLYGPSAAVGSFLADAIDTLEKYVTDHDDWDASISSFIEKNIPGFDLTQEDSADLAYLASIPAAMQGKLPDSSLRHILQVDRTHDQTTLESHLAYVSGKPYSPMVMDHGECTNAEFYSYIDQTLADWKRRV